MMKKAVITSGSKQYVVAEGETIEVEILGSDKDIVSFDVLALVDNDKTVFGTPFIKGASVTAKIVERGVKADKVTAIRYKAKKRVKKVHGHRQLHDKIQITNIT